MVENPPRREPAGAIWWQRCAGLMAIVLVFSLVLEGVTARDVAAKPAAKDRQAQQH